MLRHEIIDTDDSFDLSYNRCSRFRKGLQGSLFQTALTRDKNFKIYNLHYLFLTMKSLVLAVFRVKEENKHKRGINDRNDT